MPFALAAKPPLVEFVPLISLEASNVPIKSIHQKDKYYLRTLQAFLQTHSDIFILSYSILSSYINSFFS